MHSPKWILVSASFSALTLSSNASAQQLATANASPANPISETATSKAPADAPSATTLPTTKELLARNDEVMGGAAAWSKVTTRKIKGIYQTEDASVFLGMEVLQKTPDKLLYKISLPNGMVVRDVCDGHSAWIEDPLGGYHQYEGAALESHIRVAQYIDRGKAILLLATGKVTGVQQIGTHKTYVVEFIPQKNLISRMYFDADTGFVVHTEDVFTTPDGPYVLKLDFDDYRTVEGLKFPFRMKRTEKGAILNIRVTQVSLNAAMDDSLFLKPESAPK